MIWGLKHPRWRFPGIEALDPKDLQTLIQGVNDTLVSFPFSYRLEIAGSYARFNAQLWSDIDFNVAMTSWEEQLTARDAYYKFNFSTGRRKLLRELEQSLGLNIQVGCVDPNSRSYNTIYDTSDGKWYGKAPFQVLENSLHWDINQKKYLEYPPKVVRYSIIEDPWIDEVSIYSQKPYFQDVTRYVVSTN